RLFGRMTALLRIEGVVAGYGRGDILRGLDLALEERTVTCLVGPNGAGKSTVLKTLSGLLRPRDGRPCARRPPARAAARRGRCRALSARRRAAERACRGALRRAAEARGDR